jgi:hypothetical protein
MADEVRLRLRHVGELQKAIILWLGEKHGVTTIKQLREKWPSTRSMPSLSDLAASSANLFGERLRAVPTEYAPYLAESYFYGGEGDVLREEGWVAWNPEEVLGRKPTPSESTSLSKGIRGLEERELVETAKAHGKKRRISHVKLTFYGEVASVLLRLAGVEQG